MASQAPPPRASARMDEGSDVGDLMVSDYYMGQLLIAISGFWLLLLLGCTYRSTVGTYGTAVRYLRCRGKATSPLA